MRSIRQVISLSIPEELILELDKLTRELNFKLGQNQSRSAYMVEFIRDSMDRIKQELEEPNGSSEEIE